MGKKSQELYDKLNLALTRCGYAGLEASTAYRQIGAGAWHDAYLVERGSEESLVVRLRKKVIYGRKEVWDAQALHEDYAPVGLYYEQANDCLPGICPTTYHYRIDPELIFTLESYMPGSPLPLSALSNKAAYEIGRSMGQFFRAMHLRPAPLPGSGMVISDGIQPVAASQRSLAELWQARAQKAHQQVEALASCLHVERASLRQKVEAWLAHRAHRSHTTDSLALVNRDITPENLIARDGHWIGLIDPVPMLDSGIYYAAWFLHCYRLFLPALSDAPRYAHHHFKKHASTLASIATGYQKGYTQDDATLKQALQLGEFLWTLDLAHESYHLLQSELTPEMRLRRGDEANIKATLASCLAGVQEFL